MTRHCCWLIGARFCGGFKGKPRRKPPSLASFLLQKWGIPNKKMYPEMCQKHAWPNSVTSTRSGSKSFKEQQITRKTLSKSISFKQQACKPNKNESCTAFQQRAWLAGTVQSDSACNSLSSHNPGNGVCVKYKARTCR